MEPRNLRRGKLFEKAEKSGWNKILDGNPIFEKHILDTSGRRGRIYIYIEETKGGVMIAEIKATDWDRIRPDRVKANVQRHIRQIWRYIETKLDIDKVEVVAGIIYQKAPKSKGLKTKIEKMLNDKCLQVVWRTDR